MLALQIPIVLLGVFFCHYWLSRYIRTNYSLLHMSFFVIFPVLFLLFSWTSPSLPVLQCPVSRPTALVANYSSERIWHSQIKWTLKTFDRFGNYISFTYEKKATKFNASIFILLWKFYIHTTRIKWSLQMVQSTFFSLLPRILSSHSHLHTIFFCNLHGGEGSN